jgi:hypothetical protein
VKLTGTYRLLVKDTTINDTTLLSTDYLNHFNELVMLLEMVPDMPDMLGEAEAWAPKSYQAHFRDSVFRHKDLAVWAYENAPDDYRLPLDDCVERLNADILDGVPSLARVAEAGDPVALRASVEALTASLRERIDTMSALINGALDAAGYRDRLESMGTGTEVSSVMDQSDIDALFD